MGSQGTKKSLFAEFQIPTESPDTLQVKMMYPLGERRRLVLIVPLVGSTASQQLIVFRTLTRCGSTLASFAYRGHGSSSGQFDLSKTLVDTQYALQWAVEYASQNSLPLHVIATCFGTIPLLAQFTPRNKRWRPRSVNAVSGLFKINHILRFDTFGPYFAKYSSSAPSSFDCLISDVRDGRLDLNDDAFRNAMREYLQALFPELAITRDSFEELEYSRVDAASTLFQFHKADYLKCVNVPADIPCHFFFGRRDDVLGLMGSNERADYRRQILGMIPHAVLHEIDIDHFGRGPDHHPMGDELTRIFEANDA